MENNIYLIRHCEAAGQSPEAQLTEKGFIQANELAKFLANTKVEKVISSPFTRAIQSIEPYVKNNDLPIEIDERLSERVLSSNHLPDWLVKLEATYNDLELKYAGGESSKEAMDRIVSVVKEVINSDSRNTIIATHGNIMSLLLHYFEPNFGFVQWRNLSNPDVYRLTFSNKHFRYKRIWGK